MIQNVEAVSSCGIFGGISGLIVMIMSFVGILERRMMWIKCFGIITILALWVFVLFVTAFVEDSFDEYAGIPVIGILTSYTYGARTNEYEKIEKSLHGIKYFGKDNEKIAAMSRFVYPYNPIDDRGSKGEHEGHDITQSLEGDLSVSGLFNVEKFE